MYSSNDYKNIALNGALPASLYNILLLIKTAANLRYLEHVFRYMIPGVCQSQGRFHMCLLVELQNDDVISTKLDLLSLPISLAFIMLQGLH